MENLVTIDLGCGNRPRNPFNASKPIGVDIQSISNDQFVVVSADLAVDPIPFDNESIDAVTAFDFLEHIPRVLYLPQRRNGFVELINEISRVLKPGGIFYSSTPCYPHPAAFQDPTHVNIITSKTFPVYFDIRGRCLASMYGYQGSLILEKQEILNRSHLSVFMRRSSEGYPQDQISSLKDFAPWKDSQELGSWIAKTRLKT